MKFLLLSVLVVSLVGVLIFSNGEAEAQGADTTAPVVNVPSPDGGF